MYIYQKTFLYFTFLFSSYLFGMNNQNQILYEIIPTLRLYLSYNDIQSLLQINTSIQKKL
jgi:hypothetical protein